MADETHEALGAENLALKAENALLHAQLEILKAQLETLKAKLAANSGNSNKPPSTDPPWKKPAAGPGASRGKKRRGGRRGSYRSIPESFDREVEVRPSACHAPECNASLESCRTKSRHHHYETDLSDDTPTKQVTRYLVHTVVCAWCGKTTTAERPNGGSAFGPVFHSWVGLLRSRYRISVSQVKELCWELWQIKISEGGIINCQNRLAVMLEGLHTEARTIIHEAAVRHADETTWFVNHKLSWVWVGVARFVSVFLIRPRRNKEAAIELLGPPTTGTQVTISDRYAVYDDYAGQVCWAHLMRPFEALAESKTMPELSCFGSRVVTAITAMLTAHRHWRDGTCSDAEYRPRIDACVATVMNLLENEGATHTNGRLREPCKSMLKDKSRFFLFV